MINKFLLIINSDLSLCLIQTITETYIGCLKEIFLARVCFERCKPYCGIDNNLTAEEYCWFTKHFQDQADYSRPLAEKVKAYVIQIIFGRKHGFFKIKSVAICSDLPHLPHFLGFCRQQLTKNPK